MNLTNEKIVVRKLETGSLLKNRFNEKLNLAPMKTPVQDFLEKKTKEIKEVKTGDIIQIHSLCLDWFACNLNGKLEWDREKNYLQQGSFTLIFDTYGNKHFRDKARVIHDGIEFGEINLNPRNDVIMNPETIMFKANNQVLYEKNFLDYFEDFFKTFSFTFCHLSQIDISADGVGFMEPLIMADQGQIEWSGKGDFQPFKKNRAIGLEYEGFWLGSKRGDKFGRAYFKRRELMRSGKTYIEHFWKQNELFEKAGTTDIERLEFKLKNKELKKWIHRGNWKHTKEKLGDSNFLAKLFMSVSKTLYTFREKRKQEKVNVTRDLRKIYSLDFSLFGVVEFLDKIINIGAKRMRALKTTCKTMFELGLKTEMKFYKKQAIEIAQNINHMNWFEKKRKKWESEFRMHEKKNIPYIPIFDGGLSAFESQEEMKKSSGLKQYVIRETSEVIDKLINFWSSPQYQF